MSIILLFTRESFGVFYLFDFIAIAQWIYTRFYEKNNNNKNPAVLRTRVLLEAYVKAICLVV